MSRSSILAVAFTLSLVALGGCRSAPAATAPAPVFDAAAQQHSYDQGLTAFGAERYEQAREDWLQTVQLGPDTALANKARANLVKVDTILKSLKELAAP
jgi:TolA-binding protein